MHVIKNYQSGTFVLAAAQRLMYSCRMFMVYRIQGTTGVELVAGLHWYLKYWCGAHISWDKTGGAQLASVPLPGSLPRVKGEGVKIERPVPWNYYQNVVTSSCESFLGLIFCFVTLAFIQKLFISSASISLSPSSFLCEREGGGCMGLSFLSLYNTRIHKSPVCSRKKKSESLTIGSTLLS